MENWNRANTFCPLSLQASTAWSFVMSSVYLFRRKKL